MIFSRIKILLLLTVVIFLSSCAGSSKYMRTADSLMSPPPDKAIVRFMRPSGFGFAINFNVWDGENVVGNSVAKSQFDYVADPGKHLFVAVAENKVFMEADLEAGKTYYVITRVYTGVWKARVAFIAVNRGSEHWDKVLEYENQLNIVQPNEEYLKAWEPKYKSKIIELLSEYESKWKNEHAWERLNPEDGR